MDSMHYFFGCYVNMYSMQFSTFKYVWRWLEGYWGDDEQGDVCCPSVLAALVVAYRH